MWESNCGKASRRRLYSRFEEEEGRRSSLQTWAQQVEASALSTALFGPGLYYKFVLLVAR